MLYNVIKPAQGEEEEEDDSDEENIGAQIIKDSQQQNKKVISNEKRVRLKSKLKFVSKMLKMQKTLRYRQLYLTTKGTE